MNKKILFVSQSFYPNPGGVSTLVINLSKYLYTNGWKVYTLHFDTSKNISDKYAKYIIDYSLSLKNFSYDELNKYALFKEVIYNQLHQLEKFNYVRVDNIPGFQEYEKINYKFAKLVDLIVRKHSIPIVHLHDYQVLSIVNYFNQDLNLIFSLHAPFTNKLSLPVVEWLILMMQKTSASFFSIPEYAQSAINFGLSIHKSAVLPPITNIDRFHKSVSLYKEILIKKDDNVVITSIQRFDSKSGYEQLIRAFAVIAKNNSKVTLLLVGGTSFTDSISSIRHNYMQHAKNLVDKLLLKNRVVFTGNVDYSQLSTIYNISDIVVVLSKMECFGLVATEAMFFGKPLVVTNVGGLAYQVKNCVNGYLVSPGDIKETVVVLNKLIQSRSLRKKMGNAGKQIYDSKFSAKLIFNKYNKYYQSLINNKL